MKILISLSRLPGELGGSFMDKFERRMKSRDVLNKRDETERDEEQQWWNQLSDEAKEKYLKDHPHSHLKILSTK